MSAPKVIEVALVANLQTLGPTYITSATDEIFDHPSGMLLAARIIITSGMGSNVTGIRQLNGPIPISELELEDDYECYYYPVEMEQQPQPDLNITTGKGTFVLCLIIGKEDKAQFRAFEHILDRIVRDIISEIKFDESITGEIPDDLKNRISSTLNNLNTQINEILEFASRFEGGSLYNVGLIANLPENLSFTAKKIMLNPSKGILEEEVEDKNALKILYQIGLIDYEERDDQIWILPR